MKVEDANHEPKLDLSSPDGVRSQGHAEDVSHVLINGVGWMPVQPKSFHYYVSKPNDPNKKGVPFIQFDIPAGSLAEGEVRIELFPMSIAGIAYNKVD